MEQAEPKGLTIELLRDSLSEARAAVRSYDTKAQILGIGYIFALGVVGRIGEQIPASSTAGVLTIVIAWGLVVLPIVLFGYVLYPSRKKVAKRQPKPNDVTTLLYVNNEAPMTFAELRKALSTSDPLDELVFELLQVSKHRDIKKMRFLRALFAAAICFVGLFSIQLLQSYGF
jgi:hypothetical protein